MKHKNLKTRKGLTPIVLRSVRNPQQGEDKDGSAIPLLVGIDGAGRIRRFRCTKAIFKRAGGSMRTGQSPDGWDFKDQADFVLYLDGDADGRKDDGSADCKGAVVQVDVIPRARYSARMIPEGQRDVTTVEATIFPDGGMEVPKLKYPADSRPEDIAKKLAAIASKAHSIAPGNTIGGNSVIEELTDNKIVFTLAKVNQGAPVYGEDE